MRTCPACARENPDDRDFCECGEYLNWELTGIHQAAAAPPPPEPETAPLPEPVAPRPVAPVAPQPIAPVSPPPAPVGAHWTGVMRVQTQAQATIVLRTPEGEPAHDQTLHQRVQPGQAARVLALVRNQSGIVDNYDLVLDGLPAEWWSIQPATLYLTPYGASGTYEQEVEILLHPPRSAEAEARMWTLRVLAHSRAHQSLAASAPLALHIDPFVETATTLRPQRKKGRRHADFTVSVVNQGNAPVLVALEGEDADGELRFGFDRPPQELPPGATVATRMRVSPPKPLWIGRGTEWRFEARTLTGDQAAARSAPPATRARRGFRPQVLPPDAQIGPSGVVLRKPQLVAPQVQLKLPSSPRSPAPPQAPLLPTQGVLRQRALIPWWAPLVLGLLVVALIALYLLLPKHATVPDVTGAASAFEAEKTLTAAHLKLGRTDSKVAARPPGTVIGQTPDAGTKVDKGSAVAILVAVGSGKVKVPSIVGLTASDADAALRDKGLTLGQASPQPIDPKGKISSQIPAAGETVKAGAPVMIFYKVTPTPTPSASATATTTPTIKAGATAAAAAQAAAAAGLVPKERRVIDPAKADTVVGTIPASIAGLKPGDAVTLLVSIGFPEIAYSDGQNVRLIAGATGKPLAPIADGPLEEQNPTFSPDGHRVAYVAGGQVFLKDLDKPADAAQPLTPAGDAYRNLAWSPQGDVIALDQFDATGSDLCLMAVGKAPHCKVEPDFEVALAIHWAPDGKEILATGRTTDGTSPGIVRWRSDVPFSDNVDDWSDGEFVTDISRPAKGVVDAAISPDGNRMAVITNFGSSTYRLWFTKPGDFALADGKQTTQRACKVAWRSDSREVAITDADASCEEGRGQLTRLNPDDPQGGRTLVARANDPTYQPLR